jgi:hypothetical protein
VKKKQSRIRGKWSEQRGQWHVVSNTVVGTVLFEKSYFKQRLEEVKVSASLRSDEEASS